MKKFVDPLPSSSDVAVPDTTTYPGSDYYEIGLVEYSWQKHALRPTRDDQAARLQAAQRRPEGPRATSARPSWRRRTGQCESSSRNQLPSGADGNLFLPVDTTVMGAGMTPEGHQFMEDNPDMVDPQVPMRNDPATKNAMVAEGHCYSDNRAIIHLHGGITPWISDGTPHQWITPANEDTPFPQGVSVKNVPDMTNVDDPKDGVQTFYYTNAQSARLMFYHDHSWGITRLNVYAGEAAPYIIQDPTEQALVGGRDHPGRGVDDPARDPGQDLRAQ